MRIKINNSCNIVTGEHSTAYISPCNDKPPRPQVTVPSLKLRLDADHARRLAADLLDAAETAERMAADYPVLSTDRFMVYCAGDGSWLEDSISGLWSVNRNDAATLSLAEIKRLGYDDNDGVYRAIPV